MVATLAARAEAEGQTGCHGLRRDANVDELSFSGKRVQLGMLTTAGWLGELARLSSIEKTVRAFIRNLDRVRLRGAELHLRKRLTWR